MTTATTPDSRNKEWWEKRTANFRVKGSAIEDWMAAHNKTNGSFALELGIAVDLLIRVIEGKIITRALATKMADTMGLAMPDLWVDAESLKGFNVISETGVTLIEENFLPDEPPSLTLGEGEPTDARKAELSAIAAAARRNGGLPDEATADDIPPTVTPYPDEKTMAQRMSGARERVTLSQLAAAKAISAAGVQITKKTLQEIEKGNALLDTDGATLRAVAEVYFATPGWLLTGVDGDGPAEDSDEDADGDEDPDDDEDGDEDGDAGRSIDGYTDGAGDPEHACVHDDTTDIWVDLAGKSHHYNETDEATAKSRGWKVGLRCNNCDIEEASATCPVCKKDAAYSRMNEDGDGTPVCTECNAAYDAGLNAWMGGPHIYPCPHDRVIACVVPAKRNQYDRDAWAEGNAPPNVETKPARVCLACELVDDVPLQTSAEHPQAGTLRLLYDDAIKHRDDLTAKIRKASEKVTALSREEISATRTVESLEALAGGLTPPIRLDAPRPRLPLPGNYTRDVEGQMDLLNDVPAPRLPSNPGNGTAPVNQDTCLHDRATEVMIDDDGEIIAIPDWSDTTAARGIVCDRCGDVWVSATDWADACKSEDGGTLKPGAEGVLAGTVATPSTPAVVDRATGEPVGAVETPHRATDPHAKTMVMPEAPEGVAGTQGGDAGGLDGVVDEPIPDEPAPPPPNVAPEVAEQLGLPAAVPAKRSAGRPRRTKAEPVG